MESPLYMLCLDLGSSSGTIALFRNRACLENRVVSSGRDHSERLISELKAMLDKHGVRLEEISAYVLSSGPGSYTGLRVAFATFKAFCMVNGKELTLVSGSEIRSLAARDEKPEWKDCAIVVKTQLTATKTLEESFGSGPAVTLNADQSPVLDAALIGKYFSKATSLRKCTDTASLIEASPQYAGSSF